MPRLALDNPATLVWFNPFVVVALGFVMLNMGLSSGFFTREQRDEIAAEIANHQALLDLPLGCLVHKDLALWNILGTRERIAAFIDFDDAISGDAMDDLSLLACFHDEAFLTRAFAILRKAYAKILTRHNAT